MIKKLLILALYLFIFNSLSAQEFTESRHYNKLETPIATEVDKGKIEVRELFWYYCPHCFDIEPKVNAYIANKPKQVQFVRQPAVFSKRWVNGAIFYYVLEQLNQLEKLHEKLFNAIHVDNIIFSTKEDFIDWLSVNGVDKKQAGKVFSSFTIQINVNKAAKRSTKYKVNSVPSFVIAGKYTTTVKQAGGHKKLFKLINYLTDKEAKITKK